jgi:urease accessory protein
MPLQQDASAALSAGVLLKLMWLASPALPVGGFSYSEGLEAAVDAGRVNDEATACRWLLDQLHLGLSRSDLPAMAAGFTAWQKHDAARIEALNAWQLQTRETSELRQQVQQMGRSLAEWLRQRDEGEAQRDPRVALLGGLQPAPSWPVAFALAAVRSDAPLQEALLAFGFGWAENLVQAAIRAVPLGQSAGQRILGALADALPRAVQHAMGVSDGERQAFAPMLAIHCAQHETQYSRLFRS